MKLFKGLLLASAAFTIAGYGSPVHAETVTTLDVVSQKEVSPHVTKIDFSAFDINKDNVLSMPEVGERLFYAFDQDGNEVIDNIEFNKKSVMTIIPMEHETYTFVDHNSDGTAEHVKYTKDNFIQTSRLMRFDNNMDGLTPAEFIGEGFLKLDIDNSNVIELDEWKKAYIASLSPPNADNERYGQ